MASAAHVMFIFRTPPAYGYSGQRRPWAWVGPSRRSRPPLRLVPRPPLWLAASSPLVVTFTSDQKGAAVGSWRPDFVQCRQSGAFAPRSLSLINRTKTQAWCAGDFLLREDDELHKLAVDTVRKLGEPSPTKPSGLAAKLSSWFK